MVGRTWTTAVAAVVAATLAVPAGAEARPRSPLGLTETLTALTQLDLVGVLTGKKQPFDEVKTLTCPLTQGLVDALKPVLGASIGTLETIGCGDNVVDYQFLTKLKTPTGEIVRKQLALVAVPTKLNVDSDPLPDVVATISVINLKKFEIRVERLPGETSALPLQIEALIDDPLNGGIPRDHINVGYDARSTRAPQRWTATAELPKTAEGTTDIDVRVTQTGAGPEITTIGGLYDGTAEKRTSPMGARLKYSPAPSLSRMGLSLGETRTVVRAGSGTPTTLEAQAELVDGAARKDIGVTVGPLPESLEVAIDDPGADRRKISYRASAPVKDVSATYASSANGTVETKVVAKARDLPTGMTVEQTSARSGTFAATGGTLGSIEAGFANGDPRLLAKDHPYVNVQTDGPISSFAGRVDDLRSATFDAADGIVADLQLGTGPRKPLDALINTPDLDVDATVSDLPRHIGLRFAPATGTIDYDAFGETIQKIAAKATSPKPLIGRATRVEGQITGLPPKADITVTPGGSGIDLRTSAPIGEVEALLSSGPDGGLQPDETGADIVDTKERFVAHARVKGLQKAQLTIDKNPQGEFDGFKGDLLLGGQPIVLRYSGDDGVRAEATVRDLPKHLLIGFSPRTGKISYDAFGETIQKIAAKASGNKPFVGRATRVEAAIADLPPKADVSLTPDGGGIALETSAPIGQVEALLSSGPDGGLRPDETGADIVDTTDRFAAQARVKGLRKATVAIEKDAQGELQAFDGDLELGTQPIAVRYTGDGITAAATIRDLPKHVAIGFRPRDGKIAYDAFGDTVQRITAEARSTKPLVGRATRIEAAIAGLTPKADITLAPGGSGIDLRTSAPIGEAEALLSSGPDGGLKPDETGADIVDTPASFVAHARIKGLRQAHVDIVKGPVRQDDGTIKQELQRLDAQLRIATQPIAVRYTADPRCADQDPATLPTDGLCFDGDLSPVPDDVHVTFDRPTGAITYDASAPIASLGARVDSATALFGDAKKLDARIDRLPQRVTVGFRPAEGYDDGVDVTTDQRVGRIKAKITDGTTEAPELVDGQAKVALRKLPGQFAIAAQLYEIAGGTIGLVGYAPDPAKPEEKSTRIAAELHLGPLPDGSRQDIDLDVRTDNPNDAVPEPMAMTGRIEDIPDDMTLGLDAQKLRYTASTRIPKVTVDARNLPQGKAGDDLKGKPQNVKATITDIPTELDVDLQNLVVTPKEGEALGLVDFELWDVGSPRAALPVDNRNKLQFDKRSGNLHIQGRLLPGLRFARLTLPSGTGAETGKLKVKTQFAANPEPLDLVMWSGMGGEDRSRIELTASELKTEQEFEFIDRNGLRVDWRSNEVGTDLHLGVSAKEVGTDVDIEDLPTQAFVCVVGNDDCFDRYVLGRFPVNGKLVEVPVGTSIRTVASGPVVVSGWICLTPTTTHGTPSGAVYDSCINRTASNRVELDRLEVQSMTFGVHTGETVDRNSSGNGPEEDNLLLLHLRTDGTGLRARNINIRNTVAKKLNIIRAGYTGKHPNYVREGQPLFAIPRAPGLPAQFTMLADLDLPPNKEDSSGTLNCGAANLVTTVELPFLGTTDIFPAAGWLTGVCD